MLQYCTPLPLHLASKQAIRNRVFAAQHLVSMEVGCWLAAHPGPLLRGKLQIFYLGEQPQCRWWCCLANTTTQTALGARRECFVAHPMAHSTECINRCGSTNIAIFVAKWVTGEVNGSLEPQSRTGTSAQSTLTGLQNGLGCQAMGGKGKAIQGRFMA